MNKMMMNKNEIKNLKTKNVFVSQIGRFQVLTIFVGFSSGS